MKIAIAISGGVDSSVAALLLKQAGHDVFGLFMRNWDSFINNDVLGNPNLNNPICPQEQDYNDALTVCHKLDIPLYRVDFVKEYWDNVFSYFLNELKKGRTPNPDVMCNKYIKFDVLLKHAKKLGAEKLATGHYCQFIDKKLIKGVDLNKDQTYFLSQVKLKKFYDCLFPIGHLTKKEVREIAKKNNLITSNKKDSTGICFIGERNFKKFLENYLPNQVGDIVNIDKNKIIGQHSGLMYYTIGQRRGLNIGGTKNKLFVVDKNLSLNQLLVAEGEQNNYLLSNKALIEDVNWLVKDIPTNCNAKFRYRGRDFPVDIEICNEKIIIKYQNVKAVTPGQACVFYDQNVCLGGGIIAKVYK